jgi:hypothetical protein
MNWVREVQAGVAIGSLLGGLLVGGLPSVAEELISQRENGAIARQSIRQSTRQSIRQGEGQYIRPLTQCPSDLDSLLPMLLRDIPSYANRVSQRAYPNHFRIQDTSGHITPGYVLLATLPDFEPLPLVSREYTPLREDDTTQLFFTTLERQYVPGQAVQLQHYHWLFLTQTTQGWRLVLMFSRVGDIPANEPPTPPYDSSQGVLAQAIRLWLRDCQAGSVVPLSWLPNRYEGNTNL